MKIGLTIITFLFSMIATASNLPTQWVKTLTTDIGCEFKIELWILEKTPFAYLTNEEIQDETSLLNRSASLDQFSFSETMSKNTSGVTYEVSMLSAQHEGVPIEIPVVKIHMNNRTVECWMFKADSETVTSNVGTVGH